jgi:hypothetical protein
VPHWAGRTWPAGPPCSGGWFGPVSRRPAHLVPGAGSVRFPVYRPFFAFSAHGKKLAQ